MGCGSSVEPGPYPTHSQPYDKGVASPNQQNGGYQEPAQSQQEPLPQKKPAMNTMDLQVERYGYPPPFPPSTKKAEIFDVKECAAIDKRSSKIPESVMYGSFEEIAQHLCQGAKNDVEKLRALFIWTTSIDVSQLQQSLSRLPDPGTPLDYLLKIHWQMGNHAHFFANLCRAAGMPAVIVTGVNKSAAYQLGAKVDRVGMSAQWNAVYVDDEWRFVDVFWASTCVVGQKSADWALVDDDGGIDDDDGEDEGETKHVVNESFFLTDPDQLIATHYPDGKDWQLLENPLTVSQYEQRVYLRERFFELDMNFSPNSMETCVVPTTKGECGFEFAIPNKDASDMQFRYLLFRQRQKGDQPIQVPLERFVFFQKSKDNISYKAAFPATGKFKMDIFGQNMKAQESFDLCASYLVDCREISKNAKPLPDAPDIGWGPGVEADEAGLKAETHQDAVIESSDGNVEIKFNCKNAMNVLQNIKSNELDEFLLSRHAIISAEGNELTIKMRLPSEGDYAFNLFADREGAEGDLPNVVNYLIKCMKGVQNDPFPDLHEGVLGKGHLSDKLGVKALSHKESIIKTDTGVLDLKFAAGDDVELFCQVSNDSIDRNLLSKTVDITKDGNATNMNLTLPKEGEYGVNVFARKKSDPNRIFHVHTYLVESSQSDQMDGLKESENPVPVIPIDVVDDFAEVRLPQMKGDLVAELSKKNSQMAPSPDNLKSRVDGNEQVFTAKLPEEGEYKLDVFEKREDGSGLRHVVTYSIARYAPLPGQEPPPKPATPEEQLTAEEREKRRLEQEQEEKYKAFRKRLKDAMASNDIATLAAAIKEYESNGVPDKKDMLKKAKQQLAYLQITAELTDAMSKRDLKRLDKAIDKAENSGLTKKLGLQLQMAKRVQEQLRRIEKLRHAIMNLDQKTIAEIKSYSKPPEGVHQVLAATFMLLGNKEKDLREWKDVVIWIGKTGKESLKRRISEFNVDKLDVEVALKAKDNIKGFELDAVRDASAGAGTFYVWAMGMIEESESRFTQSGGDLSTVRPKTGKHKKGKKG